LHGLDHVGEGEDVGAGAFDVHWGKVLGSRF
jgi:hypothetical protein